MVWGEFPEDSEVRQDLVGVLPNLLLGQISFSEYAHNCHGVWHRQIEVKGMQTGKEARILENDRMDGWMNE